ncbi:Glutamate receptor ionotropic, kainate 2 [Araneus ventricosus]|uniref:Glutamate receptor ionotropic, kainate 2 n=1 Tax=Araneus ventricosus TaxID=182803 RepID=A0A4Y2KT34_ARAVE|nr:Glutamate receptor ionotropic, kainate 2 [Araneus ventricosus]
MFLRVFVVVSVLVVQVVALPKLIRIGGLFDTEDEEQELAFRLAVEFFNRNTIMRRKPEIVAQIERINTGDIYDANKKVCGLLEMGVAAIFGPQDHLTSLHVGSICDEVEVPHIETRWDYKNKRDGLSINLHPFPNVLSESFVTMVKHLGWQNFSLVYEGNYGIMRLQNFLKEAEKNKWGVRLYSLDDSIPYRKVFWNLRKDFQILQVDHKIVLDVGREILFDVLKQAQQVGMVTEHQQYLITSLDFHTIDLSDFKYAKCNLTGFRLVQDSHNDYYQLVETMARRPYNYRKGLTNGIRAKTALMFDAVNLFISALIQLDVGKEVEDFPTSSCFGGVKKGTDGTSLVNYMKSEKPYVMLVNSSEKLQGNDQYEGFCVDLIEELSKILNFKYEICLVHDEQFGKKKDNGEWTGVIGEVMKGKADMAVAGLSINSKRENAVDFTLPFMNTGISILYQKPTTKITTLFSFLSPFSAKVWTYLMITIIGGSIVTFLVGRLSPYEWINPHPCRQDDIVVENTFNLGNTFWFIIGSIMQQGSDLVPTAFSTRTATTFWSFFTLIIMSSYTANLAAFLTVERTIYPFHSAEELANQKKIKYGCLESGTTKGFFEESKHPLYKQMWETMSSDPSNFVKKSHLGKEKVKQGNYAFFMESTSIEYLSERECDLTQIGGLLDHKGYGIATKKAISGKNELSASLSTGILILQERGVLHALKHKWWKQKGGGMCTIKQSNIVRELTLDNVGGVFAVLILGLGVSVVVAFVEFRWKSFQWENPNKAAISILWVLARVRKQSAKHPAQNVNGLRTWSASEVYDSRYTGMLFLRMFVVVSVLVVEAMALPKLIRIETLLLLKQYQKNHWSNQLFFWFLRKQPQKSISMHRVNRILPSSPAPREETYLHHP